MTRSDRATSRPAQGISRRSLALACVALAALCVWLALRADPGERGRAEVGPPALASEGPTGPEVRLAALAPTSPSGRAVSAPTSPSAAADPTTDRASEALLAVLPAGRIVDALTGEPVPEMELTLVPVAPGPDGTMSSVAVTSDAQGDFVGEFERLPVGDVSVYELDAHGGAQRGVRVKQREFPFEAPIEVSVGPTFRLAFSPPLEAALPGGSTFAVRFVDGADRRNRAGHLALTRGGAASWVRFPPIVTESPGDGPFALIVTDPVGRREWRGSVTRKLGVEPIPVRVELVARGVVRFRLAPGRDVGLSNAYATLTRLRDARTWRVGLDEHGLDGAQSGAAQFLEPGRYSWSFGPAERCARGEVEVLADTVVEVELHIEDLGPLAVGYALIDATRVPSADATAWRAFVVREDDPAASFPATPRRDAADPEGYWRIDLGALEAGRWIVGLDAGGDAELEPNSVTVESGAAPPVILASPPSARVPVVVVVLDEVTGAALPAAEAAFIVDVADASGITRKESGGFEPVLLRPGREATILARAPGYRTTAARVTPSREGGEVEVRLGKGWANRVLVIDPTTMSFVPRVSVHVGGELAGHTDEAGAFWLTGDGPPERVEVALENPALLVTMSPFDGERDPDPILGWIFAVQRQ